jgi:transposase InsO family protein
MLAADAVLCTDGSTTLASWQHHYNWHRPHSGIGVQPPMPRLPAAAHNLLTPHT